MASTVVQQTDPLFTLTQGKVVKVRQQNVHIPDSDVSWAEIEYNYFQQTAPGRAIWAQQSVRGWVNDVYLEDYNDPYPEELVKIENPTPDPTDAKQYMIWPPESSDKKVNMCGELCVAYIIKKERDPGSTLESVLRNWQAAGNTGSFAYNLGTVTSGTNDSHLRNILQLPVYGYSSTDLRSFNDVLAKNGRLDWSCLHEEIKTQYFIAQVMIEGMFGSVVPKDQGSIRHWVVVEDITHNGNRVKIYNPFPNKIQEYSFSEFLVSCNINLGVFVRRKTPLAPDPVIVPRLEVALDTQKPLSMPAVQYIQREGGKKTNLCGEFSVAYILSKSAERAISYWKNNPPAKLSDLSIILKAYGCMRDNPADPKSFTIGVVLDHWRKVQPELYRNHVVNNQTTSPRELMSILRAYGYNHVDDIVSFEIGLAGSGGLPVDPVVKKSPARIAERLKTHYLIAGVGIEGLGGRLKTNGPIRHWVVVERLEPVGRHIQGSHFGGNGGWVELYNPFTDSMEEYSYREFIYSMNPSGTFGGDSGFWVKKDVQPLFTDQDVLPAISDGGGEKGAHQPKKTTPTVRWNRQKLIGAIAKKLHQILGDGKHGVPPDTADRIARQLSESGWSREEIIREVTPLLPAAPAQPSPGNVFEQKLNEKLSAEKMTPHPSIPADVLQMVRQQSEGNVDVAAPLFKALLESGFLIIGANGQYIKRSFPDHPDQRQTAVQSFMQGLSSSWPDATATDGGLAINISNVIRPMLAARAMDEITKVQVV